MNADLSPLWKSLDLLWKQVKLLFVEHNFITIVCAFFAVMMTISFYKFLRSISPALVVFVLLLILFILILHWTSTRSEPAFLKPFIDFLAPFFPSAYPTPPAPPHK
jgi:choline-glycine betaine transporter